MPDTSEPTATVTGQSIALHLTDYPDIPNRWGTGHIRPTGIRLDYGNPRTPHARAAYITGLWVREDGVVTDATLDHDYYAPNGDLSNWPGWIADLTRKHDPAAARAAALHEAADVLDTLPADATSFDKAEHKYKGGAAAERLRRLADEAQQQPETEAAPAFVTRVLEIFSASHTDAYGDLFWSVDDRQVRLFANVSDVFAWGGSDCEPITPDTLPALEQAYTDLKAVEAEEFTADLYAARQRGMRPQGAAYPSGTHESWRQVNALYDACGPERGLGLGNPKAPPAVVSAVPPQPEETA